MLFCGWVGCQGNVCAKRCASLKLILQDVTPSTPGVSALEGSSHNVGSRIGPASQACAKATIIAWLVTQFGYEPVISGLKASLFACKRAILGVVPRAGLLHPHRLVPMQGAEGLCCAPSCYLFHMRRGRLQIPDYVTVGRHTGDAYLNIDPQAQTMGNQSGVMAKICGSGVRPCPCPLS